MIDESSLSKATLEKLKKKHDKGQRETWPLFARSSEVGEVTVSAFDLRQEPSAVVPHAWDLCGGRRVTGVPTATTVDLSNVYVWFIISWIQYTWFTYFTDFIGSIVQKSQQQIWPLRRWPFLLPFSGSKRLEGGTCRSFRIVARFSMRSFLKATRCISFGNFFEKFRLNIFSVSLHLKDWIMMYYIKQYGA